MSDRLVKVSEHLGHSTGRERAFYIKFYHASRLAAEFGGEIPQLPQLHLLYTNFQNCPIHFNFFYTKVLGI